MQGGSHGDGVRGRRLAAFPVRLWKAGCMKLAVCVKPEFQGKGIGTVAVAFAKSHYEDWKKFTLITPVDKEENVRFYTENCGFKIAATEMDGSVKVVRFDLEK